MMEGTLTTNSISSKKSIFDSINYVDEYHVRLSQSFGLFAQHCFHELNGFKFNVKPFHLELFSVFQAVYEGQIQRLIVNIPPRHGKSELAALFQAYVFFNNPSSHNMLICYSSDLQISKSKLVKTYVNLPVFKKYTNLKLEVDRKGNRVWETVQHGQQFSTTMTGQSLGSGAGIEGSIGAQGGLIVIDDPNKASDMQSDLRRSSAMEVYTNTISTRINDKDTPIVVIQQRVHEEDLTGFLLGGGDLNKWHLFKVSVFTVDGDDTIYPERLTYEDAIRKQRANPSIFAGQYLQEPSPLEGNIFMKSWFHITPLVDVPKDVRRRMFIDGAYSDKTSADPTGILVTAYDNSRGMLYIVHAEKRRLNMPDLLRRIIELTKIFSVRLTMVEPMASGTTIVQLLRDKGINAKEFKSKNAKHDKKMRAYDCTDFIEGGRVSIVKGHWNADFLHELGLFPNGRHDDYVDCLCYAIEDFMFKKGLRFF